MRRLPFAVLPCLAILASVACGASSAPSADAASGDAGASSSGGDSGGGSSNVDPGSGSSPDGAPTGDAGADSVVAISAGGLNACALLRSGHVRCWGDASKGQLGNGSTAAVYQAVDVVGVTDAVEVAIDDVGCARRSDGTVWCWGSLLGDSATAPAAAVAGITNAVKIAVGADFACAVSADHTVSCWGQNEGGQLGDGTTTSRKNAAPVSGVATAVDVVAGYLHACALLEDGTVKCWGLNNEGELGDGTTTASRPVPVAAQVSGVVELAAGGGYDAEGNENLLGHTCARKGDGTIVCWGDDSEGELGDDEPAVFCEGSLRCTSTPVVAAPEGGAIASPTSIASGAGHMCALTSAGTTWCWGRNSTYAYGDHGSATPVEVPAFAGALAIALGDYSTCILKADATVWCMGDNGNGELGVPNPSVRDVLNRVVNLP